MACMFTSTTEVGISRVYSPSWIIPFVKILYLERRQLRQAFEKSNVKQGIIRKREAPSIVPISLFFVKHTCILS